MARTRSPGSSQTNGSLWSVALHVGGLWALAIAQPVFDLLGGSPEFFVAHRAGLVDVLLLVAFWMLVGPAALVGLLAAARAIGAGTYRFCVALAVGVLLGLIALPFLARALSADLWIVAAAASAAAVGALAYLRAAPFRQVVAVLSLGIVVVPAAFLARPAMRDVLWHPSTETDPASASPAADGPPIVLVVYDQFPLAALLDASGGIDRDLYPSFASLADTATWYPNATSVANKTAVAVPAIVTGVYPNPDRLLPTFQGHPDSVFSLLGNGYALHAREPVTELCPRGRCQAPRPPLATRLALELQDTGIVLAHALTPPRLAAGLPPIDTGWKGFAAEAGGAPEANTAEGDGDSGRWNFGDRWVAHRDADRRVGPAALIDSIQPQDRPAFYFLHTLLPHEPYVLLPSGRRFSLNVSTPALLPDGSWRQDEYGVALNYQRFLLQAGYADRVLGNVVARLRQTGLFDEALLVVTADHGTSFKPGMRFKDPQSGNLSDILSVPLLVKYPAQSEGRVDRRQAETVDVLPTIAEVVGSEPTWRVDGRSLLGDVTDDRTEKKHYFGGARGPRRVAPEVVERQLHESVAEKLRLMGPEGDPGDGVRFGPGANLLGRSVDDQEFRVVDLEEGHVLTLSEELPLSHVDLEADFVPRHLNGFVTGDPRRFPTADIAVAVNGVIQATGRIYPYRVFGRDGYWSVVLPDGALRPGYNAVEVFLVLPRQGRTTLRQIYANPPVRMPSRPNLLLEDTAAIHGFQVWATGFLRPGPTESGLVRWTQGHGILRVEASESLEWRALEVTFRFINPRGSDISILVDGCTLYEGRSDEAWSRTFELGECAPRGRQTVIEIVSSTFEDGALTRGVGVLSVIPVE